MQTICNEEFTGAHGLVQGAAGRSDCQRLVAGHAVQDQLQDRLRQGQQPARLVLRRQRETQHLSMRECGVAVPSKAWSTMKQA